MELRVVVRRGDWVATSHHTWKHDLADLFMSRASDLNDSDADVDAFWNGLYQEEFGESLKMNASPTSTVGELKSRIVNGTRLITSDERRELAREQGKGEGKAEKSGEPFPFLLGRPYSVDLVELPTLEPFHDQKITIERAGLQDGDVLGLLVKYSTATGYMVLPSPEPGDFFDQIRSYTAEPPQETAQIWGAILYTEEDEQVAVYIRKYFTSLNVLSGEILKLYVIERPDDWNSAKRYWKEHLTREQFAVYSNMEWLYSAPYDKSRAYEIAETLGVQEYQIPCLVLFDSLERKDKLIFPIPKDVSPAFFRTVLGAVKKAIGDSSGEALDLKMPWSVVSSDWEAEETGSEPRGSDGLSSRAFESIAARYESILKLLKPVSQASGQEPTRYEFYGQTVFVNRPAQDMHLSHFQNRSIEEGGTNG